jgi:hypothetical protein
MPIYKKNGKAVLFVHIPKSAGTTVDHIFLSNGWQVTFQDGGGRADTILRHMKCSFQHFHAALLTQIINPNSFDAVFTILRDPMTRLQSEYRWRMDPVRRLSSTPGSPGCFAPITGTALFWTTTSGRRASSSCPARRLPHWKTVWNTPWRACRGP